MLSESLRHQLASGQLVDLRTGDPELDHVDAVDRWSPDRTVPASLLAGLLTESAGGGGIHRRVRLAGARITGEFDLYTADVVRSLALWECVVDEPINIQGAEIAGFVSLGNCHIHGVIGTQVSTRGTIQFVNTTSFGEVGLLGAEIGGQLDCSGSRFFNVGGRALNADLITVAQGAYLGSGFAAAGTVSLIDAEIRGVLDCRGGTFHHQDGWALNCSGLTVAGGAFLSGGFSAAGLVDLGGADIAGGLECIDSTFHNAGGVALNADRARVGQSIICGTGFNAVGAVVLRGARVGDQFDIQGGVFHNPGGAALNGDGLSVTQGAYCGGGMRSVGEFRLPAARIGGQLVCSGGSFENPGGQAFVGFDLVVGGNLLCKSGFRATGEVDLTGAQIGGVLDCGGGFFDNGTGIAIAAERLTVGDSMFCRDGFSAIGEVRMISAKIGSQFVCNGGHFFNPNGWALNADTVSVAQTTFLANGFTADGEVTFFGSRLGGHLDCTGGVFRNSDAVGLSLESATVSGNVLMRPAEFVGGLNLDHATVGVWYDETRTWPSTLTIRGFEYSSIEQGIKTRDRLRWLRLDPEYYLPAPYEQLAAVLRREGREDSARRVLIAKQWRRRARARMWWRRWAGMAWSAFLRVTIGYGYRPWYALWPAVALLVGGWVLFGADYRSGLISAAADNPAASFSALRYTVDLLLPVAGLGERTEFVTVGAATWHAFAFTLSGWLLALVLVAGLTGVFKRD